MNLYRVALLDGIEGPGLRVAVNPHRLDTSSDLHRSQVDQPSHVEHVAALAQSHMAINFSQSSAGPFQQLKTRALEASAVGCLVLTERFWVKSAEFDYFSSPVALLPLDES